MHMRIDKPDQFLPLISSTNIKAKTHLRTNSKTIAIEDYTDITSYTLMRAIVRISLVS